MKAFIASIVLVSSISSFAAVSATEAFKSILSNGTYTGKNCSVKVSGNDQYTHVTIEEAGNRSEFFTVLNTASTVNYAFSFNAEKNEFYATQLLNFPRYYHNSSKTFFATNDKNGKAYVAISNILLDHSGNDVSTDAACEINL